MLQLPATLNENGLTTFRDHRDGEIVYCLPSHLTVSETAADPTQPDFFLLRHHADHDTTSGGLLRVGLELATDEDTDSSAFVGVCPRPILPPLHTAHFRLRLRSWLEGNADETSDWQPLLSLTPLVASKPLTPHESQLLQAMLEDGAGVVEIELSLGYRALTAPLPWLATAQTTPLWEALHATLGSGSHPVAEVVAAFLSLPTAVISWQSFAGETTPTAELTETLLTQLAHHALETWFEEWDADLTDLPDRNDTDVIPAKAGIHLGSAWIPANAGMTTNQLKNQANQVNLRPISSLPPTYSWDLRLPRLTTVQHTLTWSVTELYQALTDPAQQQKLFPVVGTLSPFAPATVHLVNSLPFDPAFLRQVQVDVRYPGLTGVPQYRSFTFNGSQPVQSFTFTYPALTTPLDLAARLTATLAPKGGIGWPAVWRRDFVPVTGLVVEIDRELAGMEFVQVAVEGMIFTDTPQLNLTLWQEGELEAAAALTAVSPTTAIALPNTGADATFYVYVGDGSGKDAKFCVSTTPAKPVTITTYDLEPKQPDIITIQRGTDNHAFLGIELAKLDDDNTVFYTLEPNQPRTWSFFRRTLFQPVRYRYRLHTVPTDSDGNTLPLVVGEWVESEEINLMV